MTFLKRHKEETALSIILLLMSVFWLLSHQPISPTTDTPTVMPVVQAIDPTATRLPPTETLTPLPIIVPIEVTPHHARPTWTDVATPTPPPTSTPTALPLFVLTPHPAELPRAGG